MTYGEREEDPEFDGSVEGLMDKDGEEDGEEDEVVKEGSDSEEEEYE